MRRGVYFILVILWVLLCIIASCSKKSSNPVTETPVDTLRLSLPDYIYIDTTRPFEITSNASVTGCEPALAEEKIIGEPFTDNNHNGVFDPGIDGFIMSGDPAINQDLNHNGRHDGPDNLNCAEWQPGIPFDDIDGNGTIRCSWDSYFCPDPTDSAAKWAPFVDFNGNGVWDSSPGIGVSRGRWWSYQGGGALQFKTDSAYRFISDSNLTYYLRGFGAQVVLGFEQDSDTMKIILADFWLSMPRVDSIPVPSVKMDSVSFDTLYYSIMKATIRQSTELSSLQVGDSTYQDILKVKLTFNTSTADGPFWEFYFAKHRGLLKAVIKEYVDQPAATMEAMDQTLPLPLTRPAR
jgi:hypothetical protein